MRTKVGDPTVTDSDRLQLRAQGLGERDHANLADVIRRHLIGMDTTVLAPRLASPRHSATQTASASSDDRARALGRVIRRDCSGPVAQVDSVASRQHMDVVRGLRRVTRSHGTVLPRSGTEHAFQNGASVVRLTTVLTAPGIHHEELETHRNFPRLRDAWRSLRG